MSTSPQNDENSLPSSFTDEVSRSILEFWFADCGLHPTKEQVMRWFMGGETFDEQCRSKFSKLLSKVSAFPQSSIISLATSPERALSLLILLDQIPRNTFRGEHSYKVFTETDPLAAALSLHSLSPPARYDLGPNNSWKAVPSRRLWFFMPLMHSEEPILHKRFSDGLLKELADDCTEEEKWLVKGVQAQAEEHSAVIGRFGRYPHRNKVLGRESTPEEKVWLENPPAWAK